MANAAPAGDPRLRRASLLCEDRTAQVPAGVPMPPAGIVHDRAEEPHGHRPNDGLGYLFLGVLRVPGLRLPIVDHGTMPAAPPRRRVRPLEHLFDSLRAWLAAWNARVTASPSTSASTALLQRTSPLPRGQAVLGHRSARPAPRFAARVAAHRPGVAGPSRAAGARGWRMDRGGEVVTR